MSVNRRRTQRDARRRSLGQNFLVDRSEVKRIVEAAAVQPGEFVVEVGAGIGVLTLPLARTGAQVLAIEPDPAWAQRLHDNVDRAGLADRVRIARADFRSMPLPTEPYRVVANPPFGLTTALLARLLDYPAQGPWRADLLIQAEVARKRATSPPTSLRSAAWAPWWTFQLGPNVPRSAFRPVPRVNATVLLVQKRDPAVLPVWLAPRFRDLLRPDWDPPRRRVASEN